MSRLLRLTVRALALAATALLPSLLFPAAAHAQRFQTLIGDTACREEGMDVEQLMNGSYITCGASYSTGPGGGSPCGAPHAYVAKLDTNGNLLWSRVYYVGMMDTATAILESYNGDYVVCGHTWGPMPGRDVFIMRLDTNGNVLAAVTMNLGGDETAWDMVESTTYSPGLTSVGDLIIAGSTSVGAGTGRDGLLLRTSVALAPIWQTQFGGPGSADDYFFGLDEATFAVPAGTAGDIIATGGTNSSTPVLRGLNNGDILVVRVNGTNGLIMAPPTGAAAWGLDQPDEGFSIQELAVAATPGDLVITGRTLSVVGSFNYEAFLLQLQADPTLAKRTETIFGDGGGIPYDAGNSVREDPYSPAPGGWGVVVAGQSAGGGLGFQNAFIHRFSSFTLLPFGGTAYGGWAHDWARSIDVCTRASTSETPGYVVSGVIQSSNILTAGDPAQLYMIKTDNTAAISSGCYEAPFAFFLNGPFFVSQTLGMTLPAPAPLPTAMIPDSAKPYYNQLCYYLPKSILIGGSAPSMADAALRIHPNPTAAGGELDVQLDLPEASEATIIVTDVVGHEVYRHSAYHAAGTATHRVSTAGWPAGVYVVSMAWGERRITASVAVTK